MLLPFGQCVNGNYNTLVLRISTNHCDKQYNQPPKLAIQFITTYRKLKLQVRSVLRYNEWKISKHRYCLFRARCHKGKIQLDVNSSHTYVSRGVWCKQPELTSIILFCRFANWPNYQDKSRQDCASGTVEAPWLKFYIKLYFFLKNRI